MSDGILVVDDDRDLREVIALVLERAGFAVTTAIDGLDALAKIDGQIPALVLLDVRMPRMDGPSFATALRRRHGDTIPIVVLTAAEHAGGLAESMGARGVILKPFDTNTLVKTVYSLKR